MLLIAPTVARADVILPVDRAFTIDALIDRSAPGQDLTIWYREIGSADSTNDIRYAYNAWICTSATDDQFGRCTTTVTRGGATGESAIELRFVESKTKAVTTLRVMATKPLYGLKNNSWYTGNTWAMGVSTDITTYYDGVGINARIPADELKKFPSGGKWVATLKIKQMQRVSASEINYLSTFTAKITIDVTDKNNIQVYLPEFPTATPRVDLNLRLSGAGAKTTLSGRSNLDMCLYDGYNSESTWFDVSASDDKTITGRDANSYSVLSDGADGSDATKRIDYNVNLNYNGTNLPLPNGKTIRLEGVNNSEGRTVMLRGIPIPVVCTPTPLTLTTPSFGALAKQAGQYRGNLRITFSPSAANLN